MTSTTTPQTTAQPDEASLKEIWVDWFFGRFGERWKAEAHAYALFADPKSPIRALLDANEALRRERGEEKAFGEKYARHATEVIQRREQQIASLEARNEALRRERDEWKAQAELLDRRTGSNEAYITSLIRERDISDAELVAAEARAEAASALAARVPALEAALREIERLGPATCEMTVAHDMAHIARAVLSPEGGRDAERR